ARQQKEIAQNAAGKIGEFIEHRVAELILVSEIERFWEMRMEDHKRALYRLLKHDAQIREVSVANSAGQEILRLSRLRVHTDADLVSLAQEEKFRRAMDGEIYIGPVYHEVTAEPFVTLAVPVRFTPTEIRGVIVAEVGLKALLNSVSHTKAGKSGYLFVVDRKGTLIAHPDYSKVLLQLNLSQINEVEEFLRTPGSDPGFGEVHRGVDGKQVITTHAAVPRPNWAVVVEEPVETALAEVKQVERVALLMLVLALSGVFGISYFFSERIARPVRALEHGASLIAQGVLDQKLDVHTGDELEILARRFNQMAEALKESRGGLERKITERTRDLSALYAALAPLSAAGNDELLQIIVERLKEATGADAALIRVFDKEKNAFVYPAHVGFPSSYLEATRDLRENSAIGQAFMTGEPVVVANIAEDSRVKAKRQLEAGYESCAFLPLRVSGELRGIIHLASREIGHFSEDKTDHLIAIARQMGVAMENRELYEHLRQKVNELQQKTEGLERADKVKDEFLSVMSHELRTPLNVVMGYTAMIKDGMFGETNPEQEGALENVLGQANDLLTMITSILYATSIETQELRTEPHRFALGDFLNDLRTAYDPPRDKALALRWTYPPDLPGVETDREKLKYILHNLIHNAIKFTDRGQVTISAMIREGRGQTITDGDQQPANGKEEELIEFKVADTGIGISQEKLPLIFEKFHQIDSSDTRPYGGIGLGLYVAKNFTELLGGKIELETEQGKGSTFTVNIPCVIGSAATDGNQENEQ
ncbi:MAG: GAF domain-containing protein, partial [Deltaproteobacteria bacterium]|nr:GAF domain-containing protein [Deltaproteobacteria bacterium]